MTTKPRAKSWSWRGKPGIDTLHVRKPPAQKNPSLVAGKNPTQHRPITLAKVWDK